MSFPIVLPYASLLGVIHTEHKSVIAEGKLSGTTWTITLPSDTDKALIGKIGTSTDVFMQIDYTGVSLAQAEGYSDASAAENMKWSSGNIMCGISSNSNQTFTVTAEDGSSKTYTVTVYVDKGALADQFWDKLTNFANQVSWWQYAEKQQSTSKYPKYW